MPIGLPYNPENCFQISQLALNANQFEPTSTAKNSVPSIIVWDTQLNVIQRVSTLTNIVLEEIGAGNNSPFIDIPRPEITLSTNNLEIQQSLYCHYLPPINDSFLNYNPKYYLFIQRSKLKSRKKDINGNRYTKTKPSGIFHPTHQNGINFPNGAYYSGQTQVPLDTEFAIANTPYTKSLINMNPLQFVRMKNIPSDNWFVPIETDFPKATIQVKIQGKNHPNSFSIAGGEGKSRSALMYFAIGIENPDTNSNYPIIFGQLSIPFKIALAVQGDINLNDIVYPRVIGVKYLLNSSSIKNEYKF
jgi:hypothetical protein